MANTLKIATDLYSKPGLNALGGGRTSYRKVSLLAADLVTSQLYALNILPAGHRLINAQFEIDKIETVGGAAVWNIGILNTYYGDAAATVTVPAAYASGGATNLSTDPQLVLGQMIVAGCSIGVNTGGRIRAGVSSTAYVLTPSKSIGVDKTKDRIVAFQLVTSASTPVAGDLVSMLVIDRDQE